MLFKSFFNFSIKKLILLVSSWEGCGGYLHANRGIITSPNYPETYPPNLNCSWHVLVQSGLTIAVHFEQPFQIPNSDSSCSQGDYLVVGLVCYFFSLFSLQEIFHSADFIQKIK